MRSVLILDTETTGLRPEDGACCIEVGCILFDVKQRSPQTQLSFLIPSLTNEAEAINRIPADLTLAAPRTETAIALFEALVAKADAVVAHNAAFDQQWFGLGLLPAIQKPWICTMSDVPWPKSLGLKGRPSVTALALAHGVPVWAAHRALTDCIYLAQVFERCDDLEALLQAATVERFLYRALVSYDDRSLAKEAGFTWDGKTRAWTKRLTEAESMEMQFPVERFE